MEEKINIICTDCNISFPATTEYFYKQKLGRHGLQTICKRCKNLRIRDKFYNNHPNYNKDYYIRNKANILVKTKEWRDANKEKCTENKQKYSQSNKGKQANKKYAQSEKGKANHNKIQAKRRRNLNWIKMFVNPFKESVPVHWHHISDAYVVAIPKDIHELYNGYNQLMHRELVMNVVKQIYLEGDRCDYR